MEFIIKICNKFCSPFLGLVENEQSTQQVLKFVDITLAREYKISMITRDTKKSYGRKNKWKKQSRQQEAATIFYRMLFSNYKSVVEDYFINLTLS